MSDRKDSDKPEFPPKPSVNNVNTSVDPDCSDTSADATPLTKDDMDIDAMFSILFNSFGGSDGFSPYRSDEDEGKQAVLQMNNRDEKYTNLLKSFVSITGARNILKEIHKWLFFWIIVLVCGAFGLLAYKTISGIMNSGDTDYILSAIPIVVTAFVSLITAIIGIPLAITHFLFNTKEDEYIVELIKHTQKHDSAGRDIFKDRLLHKNKPDETAKMEKTNDDE